MAKVLNTDSEEYKLGQQIRKYRKLNNMTQNDLADLMDMDRANIANYENGLKGEMGFKTLKRFSQVLGVSVDILLGIEPDPTVVAFSQLNTGNRAAVGGLAITLLNNQKAG